MKILLVTPLYPPDIDQTALYVKELATRLSVRNEAGALIDVTIATYGSHPEKVPGVKILTSSKNRPVLVRIFLFTLLLIRPMLVVDVIIFENGASVELPVSILSFLIRKRYIFHISDERAHVAVSTQVKSVRRKIEQLAQNRASIVITDMPFPRPEILPLEPYPATEFTAYEESWRAHLKELLKVCTL